MFLTIFAVYNFDTILLVRKQQLASLTYGVPCAVLLFCEHLLCRYH